MPAFSAQSLLSVQNWVRQHFKEFYLNKGKDFTEGYLSSFGAIGRIIAVAIGNAQYLGAEDALKDLRETAMPVAIIEYRRESIKGFAEYQMMAEQVVGGIRHKSPSVFSKQYMDGEVEIVYCLASEAKQAKESLLEFARLLHCLGIQLL